MLRNCSTGDSLGNFKKQLKKIKTHELFIIVLCLCTKLSIEMVRQVPWPYLIMNIYLFLSLFIDLHSTFCQYITFSVLWEEQVKDKCFSYSMNLMKELTECSTLHRIFHCVGGGGSSFEALIVRSYYHRISWCRSQTKYFALYTVFSMWQCC